MRTFAGPGIQLFRRCLTLGACDAVSRERGLIESRARFGIFLAGSDKVKPRSLPLAFQRVCCSASPLVILGTPPEASYPIYRGSHDLAVQGSFLWHDRFMDRMESVYGSQGQARSGGGKRLVNGVEACAWIDLR